MKKYDVIVVGSGPSGLSSILFLLKAGISNICLITASTRNYHKSCSGFLTEKSASFLKEHLNIDITKDLGYEKSTDFTGFYHDSIFYQGNEEDKYIYYSSELNRYNLDNYLFNEVLKSSVTVYENTPITNLDNKKNILYTKNSNFMFKNLILADGENSIAKKYTKNIKKRKIGFEIKVNTKIKEPKLKIELTLGLTKRGYAWITKKNNMSTIGFTDLYNKNINYIKLLEEFAKKANININKKDIKGAFIPCGVRKLNLSPNIYCIGDAAGLTDALNQEGIFYGLYSSLWATKSIVNNNYKLYSRNLKKQIKDLKFAEFIEPLFFNEKVQKLLWRHPVSEKSIIRFLMKEYLTTNNFHYNKFFKYYFQYKTAKQKE